MKRQVSYQWRLREVMAESGMFDTTELIPLLADRGIKLSSVQVWRLVTQTPERLSLPVLAALCDIFSCGPERLITTKAENTTTRKTAGRGLEVVNLAEASGPSGPGSAPTSDRADLRRLRSSGPPLPKRPLQAVCP